MSTAAAIDAEMNRVFEGTTEEVVAWLRAGSPDYVDLYLIRDTEGRILTVHEFLSVNDIESQLVDTPAPDKKWGFA